MTNNEYKANVDKFVKESNDSKRGFDQNAWNTVKSTIPAEHQAQAEKDARNGITN